MPLNLVSFKNIDTCGLPAGSAPELPPHEYGYLLDVGVTVGILVLLCN